MNLSIYSQLSHLIPAVKVAKPHKGEAYDVGNGHAKAVDEVVQQLEDCSEHDVSKGEDCHEIGSMDMSVDNEETQRMKWHR